MIVFRKAGNFYSVFDDDATILHNLFNYKLKDSRVGFPLSSIDKVKSKLDELHIDYKLNDEIKHFEDDNYSNYLIESKNKLILDLKINQIQEKIMKANFNQLNDLIDVIDNFLNERK
ncbi:MAG: hypothetical protein IJ134_02960 [Bacilli bacterium]|nr:hypothetical protein [Bacilli bacterium]